MCRPQSSRLHREQTPPLTGSKGRRHSSHAASMLDGRSIFTIAIERTRAGYSGG